MNIKKFLGPKTKLLLKIQIQKLMRILKGRNIVNISYPFTKFTKKGYDTFFGYYDVDCFNNDNQIIYLEHKKGADYVNVIIDSINGGEKKKIGTSKAWNWQQGIRLRWMPGYKSTISFNDFDNGRYFNRIINLDTEEERLISYPLYDIDSKGELGISIDFSRLGFKRPGYGYTCTPYVEDDNLEANGIDIVSIKKNQVIRRITYKEIINAMGCPDFDLSKFYINHLSFSPDGNKFLFFWINEDSGYHQASLFVYDISKHQIIPIEKKGKVSHYDWIDNDTILCTHQETDLKWEYIVYGLNGTKQTICQDILNRDGHPTVIDNLTFITDTYPDSSGYQSLYLINAKNQNLEKIGEIYHKPQLLGEKRTDLHPRVSKDNQYISIDTNSRGYRELIVIKWTHQ